MCLNIFDACGGLNYITQLVLLLILLLIMNTSAFLNLTTKGMKTIGSGLEVDVGNSSQLECTFREYGLLPWTITAQRTRLAVSDRFIAARHMFGVWPMGST